MLTTNGTNGIVTSKKQAFLEMETTLPVDVSGQPILTKAKEFSTGSVG